MAKPATKDDLFDGADDDRSSKSYSAKDIEVLEGLEPVRRRPGMYIGGTDERALHHLAAEIIDNAMDEAVAGHASRIEITLEPGNVFAVRDNGRGIPTDPHPKFKSKSALEVILTTLHSGGKFTAGAYETSGGLHGVGASVVNALSEWLEVEVARDRNLWSQRFERGNPVTKLKDLGSINNRRGTTVRFKPDVKIFGPDAHFKPARLYRMARSKAYLFRGVEIRWSCDASLIHGTDTTPADETLHFPGGLSDYLEATIGKASTVTPRAFSGRVESTKEGKGIVEWAVSWSPALDPFMNSYCNTIPTAQGGTHDNGLRSAMAKSLRAYGELTNNRKAPQ
ncbi:MAG: DNA topoisomerase IV subunit B, partial [Alphaproteobacteria bacterium]|nr:DNA topoisomerase IV subunit B [Alphaproteobacteria bacterium]